MKKKTIIFINSMLGVLAVIMYIQVRLLRAVQFNRGLPAVSVWSEEPYLIKKDLTLLFGVWLNFWIFYFFGFWITLIIFASIILGFMIKKKFFPILVIGFLAFSCQKEASERTYIVLTEHVSSLTVGDITLTESDTVMLPKGKNKYSILGDGMVQFLDVELDYIVHDHYTDIHGSSGKFRR